MKTLIKNAEVVFPDQVVRSSILIENQKIASVDAPSTAQADVVIDASGLHLLPGVIDDQVHFREPGLTHKEDLYHASKACAAGGITTFLEMPNTKPPATTIERVRDKEQLALQKSLVNFGFYIGASTDNLSSLTSAQNVPGIKIFIGSSTGELLVDDQATLERIFAETTLPICAHCEDEATVRANANRFSHTNNVADHSNIRDHAAAIIATKRAIDLATRHQHRFHVLHVSTAAELDVIRGRAPLITAEVCPHHLFFNIDDYARLGTLVQMNPSIKTLDDNRGLWQGLLDGVIQNIATDHAPHTLEEKQQTYPASPSGLPAVENSLALLLDRVAVGACTIQQVVSWMCDAPARIWGIVGKGRIAIGYDADLVLVDLAKEKVIKNEHQQTKCKWSPWHDTTLQGWPKMTWVNGVLVFDDGTFNEVVRGEKPLFDHARGGYWNTPDGIGLR